MEIKEPLPFKVLKKTFPYLEKLTPSLAENIATRFFLTPIRFGFTKDEKAFLPGLTPFELKLKNHSVTAYKSGSGPAIICSHGWAGRGVQFRKFAPQIINAGYTFVCFDAWGHGNSKGKQSSVFNFAEAIEKLLHEFPETAGVIGHSMGGVASGILMEKGVNIPALITIGSPSISEDILNDFANAINGSKKVNQGIKKKSLEKYGRDFEELSLSKTIKHASNPVLSVHGSRDKSVNVSNLHAIKSANPAVETRIIDDAGHFSILKNETLISEIVAWIDQQYSKQK
tara:strand:+ start:226 stop:1080 length:855 start_codon:yes stop_codon:yes gene_type:complete